MNYKMASINDNRLMVFARIGIVLMTFVAFTAMADLNFTLYHVFSVIIRLFMLISIFPIIKYYKSCYLLFWGLFLFSVLFICAVHTDLSYFYLLLIMFMVAVIYIFNEDDIKRVFLLMEVLIIIQLVGVLYETLFPKNYKELFIENLDPAYYNRVIRFFDADGYTCGFTVQPAIIGTFMAIGFGYFLIKAHLKGEILNYIISACCFVGVILSSKRAHLLFAVLALIICWGFKYINHKNIVAILKALVVMIIVVLAGYLFYKHRKGDSINAMIRLLDMYTLLKGGTGIEDLSSGRFDLIKMAIQIWRQSPIVGIGFNQFYFRSGLEMDVHNVFFQYLCEGGILSLVTFVLAIVYSIWKIGMTVRKLYKNKNKDHEFELSVSLYIVTFIFLYCFTGNPMFDYLHIYILGLGLAIANSCGVFFSGREKTKG